MYQLTINQNPVAASRPRVTRWSTYYTEPYNSYKDEIRQKVSISIPEGKKPIFSNYEPLSVSVYFYIKKPKLSKKRSDELEGEFHVKKPDLDNLVKAIKDAMNGLVYHDDGQVSVTHSVKFWSDNPRTEITVEKIKEKVAWIK